MSIFLEKLKEKRGGRFNFEELLSLLHIFDGQKLGEKIRGIIETAEKKDFSFDSLKILKEKAKQDEKLFQQTIKSFKEKICQELKQ